MINEPEENQPSKHHETPEELQALAKCFIVGIAWSMAGLFEEDRPIDEEKRAGPTSEENTADTLANNED